MKLRVRLKLLRAKLVRALEEAKVRSVAMEVKLRSRSESHGKSVSSASMVFVLEVLSLFLTHINERKR